MNKSILITCLLLFATLVKGQSSSDTAVQKDKALNIFVDCAYCDMDYLRTEMTFVNYVRDRMEAQVDVIGSALQTGSGGTEYTFVFRGQKKFAGKSDTLKVCVKSYETAEGTRKSIAQLIKLGLARYVACTPYGCKLNISAELDTAKTITGTAPVTDKWRSWVFSASANGFLNAQDLTKYSFIGGSLSATKITPEWKISLSVSAQYTNNSYIVPDSTITSSTKSQNFSFLYVKSMSEHFSWGLNIPVYTSTFSNIKLSETVAPGIEYSVFPYSQATHRLFRFLYSVYGVNNQYIDSTIYGKTKELLFGESLTASITYKEPWGSMNTSVTGSHYFYDFSKNNLSASVSLNLNIFEGFTLNLYGAAGLVHDQLFLPSGGASADEILLQVKQLATSYTYFTSVGFTYTFGSIFNNVVNPRYNINSGNSFSFSMN